MTAAFVILIPNFAQHVYLRPFVMAKPGHDAPVQGRVRLAVAIIIEPVAMGCAGGSGNRACPTPRGESGLGPSAFGMASSRREDGSGRVRSHAKGRCECGRSGPGELVEISLQTVKLRGEVLVATSERAEGVRGGSRGSRQITRAEAPGPASVRCTIPTLGLSMQL